MVEQSNQANTTNSVQLPVGAGAEESKEEAAEFTTMYGAQLPTMVKEMFERINLNPLEAGLLKKYLSSDLDKMPENLASLAKKVLERENLGNYARKDLERCVALFDKHEFWSN